MRKPSIHKSFLNAFKGVFLMVKNERNFQIELLAFFINLFLIFYFKPSVVSPPIPRLKSISSLLSS
ncbi:diacylglycerol kinase [Chryseobacterium oryctis]|uniref:diacylglycerol kinase n=1 Tax=Chryseobacterium oryctis TaxID=2952618 RepID=UPI0029D41AE8|nr:diacylglycerol kinase [Chryseobacterium oryctis]